MLKHLTRSPIWKKVATGLTGLALAGFVLMHMTGNLAFFTGDRAYNEYAHFLTSFGPLFYAVELVLLAIFVVHIFLGINIWRAKSRARPTGYETYKTAGSPSRQSRSSRSMIVTGAILLAFLVFHLYALKFGPGGPGNGDAAYLVSYEGGEEIRDLAKLMRLKFASPLYAFGYAGVMLLLALHLRHGVWSALQSLGAMKPALSPVVYALGGLFGLAIGVGFLVLPLALYFNLIPL